MRVRSGRLGTTFLAVGLLVAGVLRAEDVEVSGLVGVRVLAVESGPSWLDAGLGKLRFDGDDEPVDLGRALVDVRWRALPTVEARAVAGIYDTVDGAVDLTEAYLLWRPVPRSPYRWRIKAGAFYPPFSLENTDVGWTSPYTVSFSAIDSWIAEEVRTLGIEVEAKRMGRHLRSPHDLAATLGLFRGNDPLGALLSWRGWALHDRQTGLFERLPLADLPAFGPEGSFPPQEAYEEPFFSEIDGRTGFYGGVQWDYRERSRLRLHHYDNNGDPLAVEDGQWAWDTRFRHLGWRLRLPGDTEAIVQAVDGSTEMAGFTGVLVYADFTAWSLLLTTSFASQRLSLRYDDFEVVDEDSTPDDPNDENGHAWTVAWFLEGEPVGEWGRWRLGFEVLSVTSRRPARAIFGDDPDRTEELVQLTVEWRF